MAKSDARRQTGRLPFFLIFILISLVVHVDASIGDRSHAYCTCVATCVSDLCDSPSLSSPSMSLPLRMTFWSCPDDCSYGCMHNLTSLAMATDLDVAEKARALPGLPPNRVVQFHGKWPFWRFLGIQEPASVIFSLANMFMHVRHGLAMSRRLPVEFPKPLRAAYRMLPLAGINLWIWSTIFHTRDKPWTEKMDYFSAAFSMMCSLYAATVRLARLYSGTSHRGADSYANVRFLVGCVLAAIFLCHISYLTFWRFDYGYNMAFNITIGLLHNLLWSAWSFYQYFQNSNKRAPHYARPFLVLTLLSSLIALELLDFPPIWRIIDAHSLWHLSTIPVIKLWYDCLVKDAWWLVGRSGEQIVPEKRTLSGLSRSREG